MKNFVAVPREIFKKDLSLEALALFVFLLNLPDFWDLSVSYLSEYFSLDRKTIRKFLNELEAKKLLYRTKIKGSFALQHFKTDPLGEWAHLSEQEVERRLLAELEEMKNFGQDMLDDYPLDKNFIEPIKPKELDLEDLTKNSLESEKKLSKNKENFSISLSENTKIPSQNSSQNTQNSNGENFPTIIEEIFFNTKSNLNKNLESFRNSQFLKTASDFEGVTKSEIIYLKAKENLKFLLLSLENQKQEQETQDLRKAYKNQSELDWIEQLYPEIRELYSKRECLNRKILFSPLWREKEPLKQLCTKSKCHPLQNDQIGGDSANTQGQSSACASASEIMRGAKTSLEGAQTNIHILEQASLQHRAQNFLHIEEKSAQASPNTQREHIELTQIRSTPALSPAQRNNKVTSKKELLEFFNSLGYKEEELSAIATWVSHKREKEGKITPKTFVHMKNKILELKTQGALIEAINYSIAQGYRQIFKPSYKIGQPLAEKTQMQGKSVDEYIKKRLNAQIKDFYVKLYTNNLPANLAVDGRAVMFDENKIFSYVL